MIAGKQIIYVAAYEYIIEITSSHIINPKLVSPPVEYC